jgi:hypothetical protein
MQRVSGVLGMKEESEEMDEKESSIISYGLRKLMHNKYGDLILLFTVTAAFGMLLALSTFG